MAGIFNLDSSKIKYQKKDLTASYKSIPQPKAKEVFSDEFFSNSPPSIFIGSKLKYPNVNIGILAPPERVDDVGVYDSHKRWVENDIAINEILSYRGNLINSRFKGNVHCARGNSGGKFFDVAQEVGMAKKQVDMEFQLKKKVKLSLRFDKVNSPLGSSGQLKDVKLAENPKLNKSIEKTFYDTDLGAADALKYLYKKSVEDQKLSQVLSLGTLGIGKSRKLVPTRWSITAVDDTLGKHIISEAKHLNVNDEHTLYFGNFLGNYYLVFLFPDVFSYELFELYLPGSSWNPGEEISVATDYEDYYGRKKYASNCVGGYYAARLPLVENMKEKKKQSSALILRFETPEYWASLGVFVVRAAMRKTMNTIPITFESREQMFEKGKEIIQKELGFDINCILSKSVMLEKLKTQTKLTTFF